MPLRNGYQFFSYGVAMLACALLTSPLMTESANSQTVIYDGTQDLNFFSSSRLSDTLALPIVEAAGADPAALEAGDGAWVRSAGRRMRNIDSADVVGTASTAVGAPTTFFSANPDSTNPDPLDPAAREPRGTGAGFVLYDTGNTTGLQTLNFSLYYNDATPNLPENAGDDPAPRNSGGNVAVRVLGINDTGDLSDPWATDDFSFLASAGGSAALVAAAQYRDQDAGGAEPVVEQLLFLDSSNTTAPDLVSSSDWQDLSFQFQAGAGYDWLIFAFAGAEQDDTNLASDRYGFANISFEPAPIIDGDYNEDGVVDAADYAVWRNGDSPDSSIAGYNLWVTNYGSGSLPESATATSVPEPGTLLLVALGLSALASTRRN